MNNIKTSWSPSQSRRGTNYGPISGGNVPNVLNPQAPKDGKKEAERGESGQLEELPQLYVKVIEVKNLSHKDNYGDLYCVLKLESYELKTSSQGMKVHLLGTKWPEGGEEFVFHANKSEKFALNVTVWNEGTSKTEPIGETTILLNNLENKKLVTQGYPLFSIERSILGRPQSRGEIQLSLYYSEAMSSVSALMKLQAQYVDFLTILLEPELAVVSALCDAADVAEADKIAPALIRVFEFHGQTETLLKITIQKEVKLTVSSAVLFRSNSMAIKLVSSYGRIVGGKFLRSMLGSLIQGICQNPDGYEVDPLKMSPTDDLKQNSERLRVLSQQVFNRIVKESENGCPVGIRKICNFFRNCVQERFTEFWYTAVGGFYFLRFVCPALVSPKGFEVYDGNISEKAQRVLVLISKVLQNLANGREFKEDFMRDMNVFIVQNTFAVNQFFESISEIPTGEASVEQRLSLSSVQILSDMYLLHHYLLLYLNKIAEFSDQTFPITELTQILHRVSSDKDLMAKPYSLDPKDLYEKGALKLQEPIYIEEEVMSEEDAGLLNVSPVWLAPARDLCVIASELLFRIYRIYITQVKGTSDFSNWASTARNSKEFKRFVEATGELQNVELRDIPYAGRLAFWINVYNTLMLHQHVILGPPDNLYRRRMFFSQCKYQIGAHYFSLNDIFFGLLRGNPKNVITRHRQFRGGDPRRVYILPMDPRIHFALSILTESTPFVRIYTAKTIEEELQRAGEIYMKHNVQINLSKKEIHLPWVFTQYESDFPKRKDDELFKWIFQFLPPKGRLDLLLLMEWGDFYVIYKSHSWEPHNREETKKAEASDAAFYAGNFSEEMAVHISKRKTAIVNIERKRRSVLQVKLMIDELKETGKSPTFEASSPPVATAFNEVEMQKEEEQQEAMQTKMLANLVDTIESAIKNLFTSLEFIANELRHTTKIDTVLITAKSIKSLTKELEEFRGLASMQDVLQRRPSMSPSLSTKDGHKSNSYYIVVEQLTDSQKESIPEDKQEQFLKLSGAIQTMIRDIKYILHSMAAKLRANAHNSEIVSTARLLSKIKKSLEELMNGISIPEPGFQPVVRKNEKTSFQLILVTQIKDIRNVLTLVKLELQQTFDTPVLIDKYDHQNLVVTIGKIITYMRKQLLNTQITLPPFQLEGSVRSAINISATATTEEKRKLLELTKSLVAAVFEVDKVLAELSTTLQNQRVMSAVDIAIQLRNMRIALSLIKGKRRKMSNPENRLSLNLETGELIPRTKLPLKSALRSSTISSPISQLPNRELEDLRVLYEKEVQYRKAIEQEFQKVRKQASELQKEMESVKAELIERKKANLEMAAELAALKQNTSSMK